ncbi:MAG: DMT family transporter [Chitinophagales bacterium]
MKSSPKAHLFILLANIIYGINYSIGKIVLESIPAFGIVLIRVTISMLIFWFIHQVFIKERIEKTDRGKLLLASLFGVAVNQLLFFKGLSLTSEIHSALIMITTPIIVLLMAWIILKDRITILKTIGIIVGGSGVALLISSGAKDIASPSNSLGDIFIMINASSYAVFLVITKPLMQKYAPLTIAKWIFIYGFFLVLPFGINDCMSIDLSALETPTILALIYVVLGATVLAYLFNMLGLNYGNPALVSIYIYTQPVIATIIAVLSGSDYISAEKIISSILVFSGVALVSFTGNVKPLKPTL